MLQPVRFFIHRLLQFIIQVYRQFDEDRCATRAASLAYTTLLSVVPLMTVALVVLRAFPNYQNLIDQVQHFIFSNFVSNSAQTVEDHLNHFVGQAKSLSATSLVFLIITAVLMLFNVEQALNAIWKVRERRKGITAFLIYWAVLTLVPIILAIGFTLSQSISKALLEGPSKIFPFTHLLQGLSPLLTVWIAFSLLYITVPNCKVDIRSGMIGAFVAAILFQAAKYGFSLYVRYFPTYALVYGALAAIPIFLVWIYLSWWVVLLGAVISHVKQSWND